MATLIIDGQTVHAEEGQTILEVARENGIEIPTLCYHPLLETYGACRLCTVEVIRHGRSKLETACTHPAWDGLEIKTHSTDVNEVRKVILGLFLSRCPEVPIIQDLARQYGVTEPPFPPEDLEQKCILCGLCVRVCHELVKADVLNFSQRGIDRQVGPPFLEKTRQCIGCGACTIICPTGAIEIVLEEAAIYGAKPLGPTSAVWVPSMQAVPRVPVIDKDSCIHFRQLDRSEGEIVDACQACQMLCEADAINFDQQDEILELDVGTVIVATGFEMWDPHKLSQYSYGKSPNVITGLEFERLSNSAGISGGEILTAEGDKPERVAIIHCVGSRDHNAHEYCSRFCCMYSLKHAHLVRDKTDAEVYEFYMDMRTFGSGYEEFYERIQKEEGITMVRGRGASVEVLRDGKLRVKGEDADLGELVHVDVDMVVLSSAVEAPHDADQVGSMLGLSRKQDGFFAEAHPKLRPVETNTEGVFLAGAAQGPKDVPDTVGHAGAAASMALALLDKGEVTISPQVAVVDEKLCSACKTCLSLCPYTAISFIDEENVARVNEALCKGCGTCVAACPAGAITARHFTTEQIMAQIEGLFRLPETEEELVEAEVEGVGS
ncbi:MAG TPA: 4Fe-4S dicluster domain-containing protein [Chloroflexi bacterium]|nr:4Fe-4S dicluster domain-containing protein [Chloroflexota bacterium]